MVRIRQAQNNKNTAKNSTIANKLKQHLLMLILIKSNIKINDGCTIETSSNKITQDKIKSIKNVIIESKLFKK